MPTRYVIRAGEAPAYRPAHHSGTVNRRLVGPDTVGATRLEILQGTIQPGEGAARHAHPGIEQACYVLAGRALAEVGGGRHELAPGDCCFFPAGEPHVLTAIGDAPLELLVVYSPPYQERPDRVVG